NIRLPVSIIRKTEEEPQDLPAPVPADDKLLRGIRVFVVDDDPGAAEILRRMLESYGAEPVTATSGAEALQQIMASPFDIILSDIGMPEMDGYELIRLLRESGSTTPAVAVTAFARPEDRIRSLEAGFSMHLAKPIEAREMLSVIQAVLRIT